MRQSQAAYAPDIAKNQRWLAWAPRASQTLGPDTMLGTMAASSPTLFPHYTELAPAAEPAFWAQRASPAPLLNLLARGLGLGCLHSC